MTRQNPTTTVVALLAILGGNLVVTNALALLPELSGYDTPIIQESPPGLADGLLDGGDVLLLSTGLSNGVLDAFLSIVRGNSKTATPVLTLSTATEHRLDERSMPVAWPSPLEDLKQAIEAALTPSTNSKG